MIKAVIFLCGLSGIDKPEPIKNFECETQSELVEELKRLQKGYCEKGDRVSVPTLRTQNIRGKDRTVIGVDSGIDYNYQAVYPMKYKNEFLKEPAI